jgi:hypothetical protein
VGENRQSRFERISGRTTRALGVLLLLLDVGSLSLLLGKLGLVWWGAIAAGAGVGGITTYESQWRFLLSKRAYRRVAHPLRFVLVALVVLVFNAAGFWLVAQGLFFTYLFTRLVTAAMVAAAWWSEVRARRSGPR